MLVFFLIGVLFATLAATTIIWFGELMDREELTGDIFVISSVIGVVAAALIGFTVFWGFMT